MKPLILVLLLTVPIQAQTLADAARKERARQAQVRSTHVIIAKGAPAAAAEPESEPAAPEVPAVPSVPAVPPAAAPSAQPVAEKPKPPAVVQAPVVDPVKQWNEEIGKLRARVQTLQDQETALQLQVNDFTNQFFAPVSDQNSRDQAQAHLAEAQNQLMAVRTELDQARKALDAMQLQGPPKP